VLSFTKIKILSIYLILILTIFFASLNLKSNNLIDKKVNLGLDLQGGSYILLEIDTKPIVNQKLQTLLDVGLSYIHLGQRATTLSGGEAQRIKLAKELSKRSTGKTVYILDEPTTGLHFDDIRKLLEVLHTLVDQGNTVIVIEHNLEVIKTADWIIDIGPEGGEKGGEIVATGTPDDIVKVKASYTGHYLKPYLKTKRKAVS